MQYKENEILKLVENYGKKGKKGFIKKGSQVKFVKLMFDPNKPDRSMVAVSYKGRILVVPEIAVKIPSWFRRKKIEREFNKKMMKNVPTLRKYHPVFFIAWYFKFHYAVKKVASSEGFFKKAFFICGGLFLLVATAGIVLYLKENL